MNSGLIELTSSIDNLNPNRRRTMDILEAKLLVHKKNVAAVAALKRIFPNHPVRTSLSIHIEDTEPRYKFGAEVILHDHLTMHGSGASIEDSIYELVYHVSNTKYDVEIDNDAFNQFTMCWFKCSVRCKEGGRP
jgi:hypothetical protein